MILGLAVGFELVFSWLIVLFGYEVNVILPVQIKKLFVILFYFYFFIGWRIRHTVASGVML
jgi:hypothetical protein